MKNIERPEVIQKMINDVLFSGVENNRQTIIDRWLEAEHIDGEITCD